MIFPPDQLWLLASRQKKTAKIDPDGTGVLISLLAQPQITRALLRMNIPMRVHACDVMLYGSKATFLHKKTLSQNAEGKISVFSCQTFTSCS